MNILLSPTIEKYLKQQLCFYFESSNQNTSYFTMSSLTVVFPSEVGRPDLVPVSFLCRQLSILSSLLLLLLLTGTFKLTTWSPADPKPHHQERVWLLQECRYFYNRWVIYFVLLFGFVSVFKSKVLYRPGQVAKITNKATNKQLIEIGTSHKNHIRRIQTLVRVLSLEGEDLIWRGEAVPQSKGFNSKGLVPPEFQPTWGRYRQNKGLGGLQYRAL